ncbi:MAG: hypothetical protein OEY52_15750 [Gammaproteobacteria bacterium]|nr:hypothetical protein [Gammaproteobacteria bacterium]
MYKNNKFNFSFILAIVLMISCTTSNATNYNGYWLDNGMGVVRIGNLKITDTTITIENEVTYTVTLDKKDGEASIYKVQKHNTKTDPFGCGPESKAHYIILQTMPGHTGTSLITIRLTFYGRSTTPVMSTIDDEPGVCAMYSFRRTP